MKVLPPGTNVGLWVRVSSDGQVRDESPAVHLARARDYADLNGWVVVEVYQLDAVSGASVIDHPEAKRMWRDVEHGRIEGLVFSAVARVGRDLIELLLIEKHLRTHGKYMISTRRGVIDTSTPEGMDSFVTDASRAQSERLELSARIIAGLKTRAKLGQFTASVAPYGYAKIAAGPTGRAKKLEIDPVEGPVRALMYSLFLQHRRLMTVAKILNSRGYRNRAGSEFTFAQIKRILLESSAKGVYYSNRTQGNGSTIKPESEWIAVPCPALVSVEDWERCQAILNGSQRPRRSTVYPYSGLLSCRCGKKMYVRASLDHNRDKERFPPLYKCQGCGDKIHVQKLDVAIGQLFRGFLLGGLPDSAKSEHSQIERQLQGLKTEFKKTTQALRRWAEAYEAGALDLDSFKNYRAPLIERQKNIESEIQRIEAERRTDKEQLAAQARAAEILESAAWSDLYPDEKQALLQEFVQSIVLQAETIQVQLLYTPPFLQLTEPSFAQLHTLTIQRPDRLAMPNDRRAWGYWLHKVRKERGDTARAVSRPNGFDETYMRAWEMLSQVPYPSQIPKIIKYIGFVPWVRSPYAQPTLGAAVRAAREIKGLTQVQLCEQAGIRQASLSMLEKDQGKLSDKAWGALENCLGIEVRRVFQAYLYISVKESN